MAAHVRFLKKYYTAGHLISVSQRCNYVPSLADKMGDDQRSSRCWDRLKAQGQQVGGAQAQRSTPRTSRDPANAARSTTGRTREQPTLLVRQPVSAAERRSAARFTWRIPADNSELRMPALIVARAYPRCSR
jgi:hypothetical protein